MALLIATTVPVAPLESVIDTPFLKSRELSSISSSPTSTPLAVAFKIIFPSPVSSSSRKPSLASVPSVSVPSRISVLPKSSFASKSPASEPLASVPSNTIKEVGSCSRNASSKTVPPTPKTCLGNTCLGGRTSGKKLIGWHITGERAVEETFVDTDSGLVKSFAEGEVVPIVFEYVGLIIWFQNLTGGA